MPKIRWSTALTLIGALGYLIATIFHPPLTDPWDTGFAFHEVVMHHHWVLDHWVFFLGLTFWYIGLARQSNIHSISNDHTTSGGLCAASCFIGSFVMWMMILTVEIAVFPPLTQRIIINNDQMAKEIWNALFTWGLFAGYLAMGLTYIGIILMSISLKGLLRFFAILTGIIGILGVMLSFLLPEAALIIQLCTAPFPYIWTIWFSLKHLKT